MTKLVVDTPHIILYNLCDWTVENNHEVQDATLIGISLVCLLGKEKTLKAVGKACLKSTEVLEHLGNSRNTD